MSCSQRDDVAVGRVVLEQRVLDACRRWRAACGVEFAGERRDVAVAEDGGGAVDAERCGELLTGGERFEADAVAGATALFVLDDDEDSLLTGPSLRTCSFSTSWAAISAGVPVSIWVCFCFSGR